MMEPPSYEDACSQPPLSVPRASDVPPPPTYREAVATQADPFPLLTPPSVPTSAPPPPPNSTTIVHPLTQVGVTPHVTGSGPVSSSVVVTQPRPVPISPAHLSNISALVCCPTCQQVVSTKVKRVPNRDFWLLCVLSLLSGVFCVCCIFCFTSNLFDIHHYCPRCKRLLHVYKPSSPHS